MTQIRLALMYFFMVAHKAACLLEVHEDMAEVLLLLEMFLLKDS